MTVKSSIKPTIRKTINTPKQKLKNYAIPDKAKPILLSGIIIAASVAFFPQEPLYKFLLTARPWQSHTEASVETRHIANEQNQNTYASTYYYINTSSQMIFLPNKQYQKATLVTYTSPDVKPSQFEYLESGSWSISGQYIEATPNNISDNSLSNDMVNLLQRNNLLDIKAKQTYHMSVSFFKKPILKNLSFMPREFY